MNHFIESKKLQLYQNCSLHFPFLFMVTYQAIMDFQILDQLSISMNT